MSTAAAIAKHADVDPQELDELLRLIEAVRRVRPWWSYQAGRPDWPEQRRFQLQFHKAPHINRVLALGNGAGKTTVMATEVNWWLTHTHPFQQTPAGPVQVVWLCLAYKQMELLRRNVEERLSEGWVWQESKKRYLFPDGSTLTIASADGVWAQILGIEPDLVVIDEEPGRKWWGEFQMRRRVRPTRFIIGATATQGKRWIYSELYVPWLKWHQTLKMSEDEAMVAQRHPVTFMWAKGGLEDNPAATPAMVQHYRFGITYTSDAERQVRNHGGFADFNTAPVFNQQALDKVDAWRAEDGAAGAQGLLIFNKKKSPAPEDGPPVYDWIPNGAEYHGGRITIFQLPEPDRPYVLGADFAQGLITGDMDAAMVCAAGEDGNLYQVAEALGHWGGQRFTYVLAALGWFYNYALLVGERNAMGLDVLRRLHDELGYTYQYMADDDPQKYRRKSDRLGYAKFHGSLLIPRLQWAVGPVDQDTGNHLEPRLYLRSGEAMDQFRRYQYKPTNTTKTLDETPDRKLTTGAEAGTHDDLVSAAAGCVTGWIELPKYQRQKPRYAPGTAGDVLGHAKLTAPPPRRRSAFTHRAPTDD